MRLAARPASLLLALTLAACSAAPAPPPIASKSRPITPSTGAPAAEAPPAPGPPVLVSQRLPFTAKETPLDADGKHVLVQGTDGLHVVDVATGETHGVLPGEYSWFLFAPGGHRVIASPTGKSLARLWDLRLDTTRDIPLAHPHRYGPAPVVALRGAPAVITLADGGASVIDLAAGTTASFDAVPSSHMSAASRAATGALATIDGTSLYLFDASGKLLRTIDQRSSTVALDPDGTRVAVSDGEHLTILDFTTAASRPATSPCTSSSLTGLEWSDDGLHLFVACNFVSQSPSIVSSLSPDGKLEREIMHLDAESLSLAVHDKKLAVSASSLGVVVFDGASGRELQRLRGPGGQLRLVSVSASLDRALFRERDQVASLTLVERRLPARALRLAPAADSMRIEAEGPLLRLSREKAAVVLDPVTGIVSPAATGLLTPDGKKRLVDADDGIDLVDLAGAPQRLATLRRLLRDPAQLSPRGAWAYFEARTNPGFANDHPTFHIFDTTTGHESKKLDVGDDGLFPKFSPDDATVAFLINTGVPLSGSDRCPPRGDDCRAIRVFDPRSGRRLTQIRPSDRNVLSTEYVDAGHLLVSGRVYEAKTGRLAWSLPARAQVTVLLPGIGQIVLDTAGKTSVVEAATGKLVSDIAPIAYVSRVSANQAFLIGVAAGVASLWSTATWTATPFALPFERGARMVLSNDGRIAYVVQGSELVVHRIADHQSLRRALPRLDFDLGEDGHLDFSPGGEAAMRVRSGSDIERSPIGPLTLLGERRVAGLFAGFVKAP